jgi:mRNA interferase HicA
MKTKQFLKLLKAAQAEIIKGRGKGGHYLVRLNGKQATLPVHGDVDYDPDFLDDICKQLKTRLNTLKGIKEIQK